MAERANLPAVFLISVAHAVTNLLLGVAINVVTSLLGDETDAYIVAIHISKLSQKTKIGAKLRNQLQHMSTVPTLVKVVLLVGITAALLLVVVVVTAAVPRLLLLLLVVTTLELTLILILVLVLVLILALVVVVVVVVTTAVALVQDIAGSLLEKIHSGMGKRGSRGKSCYSKKDGS